MVTMAVTRHDCCNISDPADHQCILNYLHKDLSLCLLLLHLQVTLNSLNILFRWSVDVLSQECKQDLMNGKKSEMARSVLSSIKEGRRSVNQRLHKLE